MLELAILRCNDKAFYQNAAFGAIGTHCPHPLCVWQYRFRSQSSPSSTSLAPPQTSQPSHFPFRRTRYHAQSRSQTSLWQSTTRLDSLPRTFPSLLVLRRSAPGAVFGRKQSRMVILSCLRHSILGWWRCCCLSCLFFPRFNYYSFFPASAFSPSQFRRERSRRSSWGGSQASTRSQKAHYPSRSPK